MGRIELKALQNYAGLSEPERVWYTVTRLLFNIRNGGLISYYYNGYAVHLDDCMRSLELLEAEGMLGLMKRTNALFGATVPKDMETINDVIASWVDDLEKTGVSEELEAEDELGEANAVERALQSYVQVNGLET
jgi:hypothetical protein